FMSDLDALVRRLFETPGQRPTESSALRAGAADCHRSLLASVAARASDVPGDPLAALLASLAEVSTSDRTWPILNHPLLVNALHCLAPEVPELRAWDELTVPAEPDQECLPSDPVVHGCEKLNNVAWPFLLRRSPSWCGRLDLCTDSLGFVRFPFSDW